MIKKGKTNLELIQSVKKLVCQVCKKEDCESYLVTVSSIYDIVEITCNDCWVDRIKKKLHEVIDEEFE